MKLKFPFSKSKAKKEKIYIIPTRWGMAYFIAFFLILIFSIIFGNPLSYLISFLLFSSIILTALMTYEALRSIEIEPQQKQIVSFERQQAKVFLQAYSHFGDFNIGVFDQLDFFPKKAMRMYDSQTPIIYDHLNGEVEHKEHLKLKAFTNYPFGLFCCWKRIKIKCDLFIIPNGQEQTLVKSQQQNEQGNPDTIKSQSGPFEQFNKVEEYNLQKIEWKIYAKKREFFQRQNAIQSGKEYIIDYEKIPGGSKREKLRNFSATCYKHFISKNNFIIKFGTRNFNNSPMEMRNCWKAIILQFKAQ